MTEQSQNHSPGGGAKEVVIAIDLGGTFIKLGLLNNGQLLAWKKIEAASERGLRAQFPRIEKAVEQLLDKIGGNPDEVLGIGLSFAGLVDSDRNRIISTNQKYDDGPDTDLTAWAEAKWNCPLFAMNDARMALLGEWKYGAGQGCADIVLVTLGTGIGSAVLINGELLTGKHFQAGNLGGHFTVNYKGSLCTCGNKGCMESEASTWRLPSLLREHPGFKQSSINNEEVLDFKALFHHAQKNDKVASEMLAHCLSAWAAGIITMIHAFDPEMIILSGGIMKSSAIILPALKDKVSQLAWTPWGEVKLTEAKHSDTSALYGADYLVRSKL